MEPLQSSNQPGIQCSEKGLGHMEEGNSGPIISKNLYFFQLLTNEASVLSRCP